ncbi:uncharacterized protein N7498_002375 [Penicillium cinerascens]|uniref:Tc1-like transposase DDE domain-containing protein n=1 Tax=Penicillium cinerascens TaxID=70096 RepID=A0A9W9N9V4_9EURO|nr:uncharacterized protein N7498_002375 [Penicillium cinerascens]KAJ5215968.1 hypothetical protein N7498_002375 [Penicillium cinerascens]
MQEGVRCHWSIETRGELDYYNVGYMRWPPYSPDLNPIESTKLLSSIVIAISTHQRYELSARQAWDAVPEWYLQRLVESMHSRGFEVIKRDGHAKDTSGLRG